MNMQVLRGCIVLMKQKASFAILDKESVLMKGTFLLNWDEVWNLFRQGMGSRKLQGPVVCRPISDNPGLTFNQGFLISLFKSLSEKIFPNSF